MREREQDATGSERLRVLVVDDSPVARAVLRSILESDPGIEVVGLARNGWEAVQLTSRLRPDVITMDVRMPEMDGVEATEQIMAYYPTPILIVTASLAKEDVDFSFRMLEAGALDIFEKPAGDDPVALRACAQALVERVRLLSRVRVITHLRGRRRRKSEPTYPLQGTPQGASRLVVIGASTGGPKALQRVLSRLPSAFPAPILVVQHIASGFIQGMCEWLAGEIRLPIGVARDGEVLEPGRVYVAPENRQLVPEHDRLHVSDRPRTTPMPSVDVTMQEAARVFGARAVGVLLTGMGSDGAQGLLAIRKAGGQTMVQDQSTCTIYGMPRAAIELGAAQKVLPVEEIASALMEAVYQNVAIPT